VTAETGIGRTHLYALEKQGRFPPRIKLARRAVGWLTADVLAWRDQQLTEQHHQDWKTILKEREKARRMLKRRPEAAMELHREADRKEFALNRAMLRPKEDQR
jgi:predicted DNA-binding transcriptional regulator AlpA